MFIDWEEMGKALSGKRYLTTTFQGKPSRHGIVQTLSTQPMAEGGKVLLTITFTDSEVPFRFSVGPELQYIHRKDGHITLRLETWSWVEIYATHRHPERESACIQAVLKLSERLDQELLRRVGRSIADVAGETGLSADLLLEIYQGKATVESLTGEVLDKLAKLLRYPDRSGLMWVLGIRESDLLPPPAHTKTD